MEQATNMTGSSGRTRGGYPLEDRAIKAGAQMLGEALVSLTDLGLHVTRMMPTEQVVLHIEDFMEDFNYEVDDDKIVHLEFESDELTKEDLMRFRGYESVLSYQQKKEVFTCVLCSAKAEHLLSEIQIGINVYRVKVIRLKDWNADELLDSMEEKQENTVPLSKEELLKLVLLPLMNGSENQFNRIRRGFEVLRGEENHLKKTELRQLEEVLYVLAVKFLRKTELKDLEEVIKMTDLGQMLYDDGWNAGVTHGITQGITKGLVDSVLLCLSELGTIPQQVSNRIQSTTDEKELKTWLKAAKNADSIEQFCKDTGFEK